MRVVVGDLRKVDVQGKKITPAPKRVIDRESLSHVRTSSGVASSVPFVLPRLPSAPFGAWRHEDGFSQCFIRHSSALSPERKAKFDKQLGFLLPHLRPPLPPRQEVRVGVELLPKLVLRNKPARLPEDGLQGSHIEVTMSGNGEDLVAAESGYVAGRDLVTP